MAKLEETLASLSKLSRGEIQKVYDQCEAMLALTKAGSEFVGISRPDDDDWYARAVGRYAVKKGWWSAGDLPVAMSNKALALLPGYKGLSTAVRDRMRKQIGGKLEPVQWDVIGDISVKAVVVYLRAEHKRRAFEGELTCHRCTKQMPGTRLMMDMYLLLQNVGLVFTAIDYSFPDYMKCGGLLLLVPRVGER